MKLLDMLDSVWDITRDIRQVIHIWRKGCKRHRAVIGICAAQDIYSYHIHSAPSHVIEEDRYSDFIGALGKKVDLNSEDWCVNPQDLENLKSNMEDARKAVEQFEEELNAELHSD